MMMGWFVANQAALQGLSQQFQDARILGRVLGGPARLRFSTSIPDVSLG